MALEYKDRVADTTATTGTGTITVDGAVIAGRRSFAQAHTNGATVRFLVESQDKTEWELVEGVWNSATSQLTRPSANVIASSNAGALVNFSAGTKNVYSVWTSRDAMKHKVSVKLNTAASLTSAGWQKVPLDTAVYDTPGWFNAATKRIVPLIEGYYQCTSRTRTNGNAVNAAAIGKSGSLASIVGPDTGSVITAVEGTDVVYCNGTTDYLESWAFSGVGGSLTVGVDNHLTVIGPL